MGARFSQALCAWFSPVSCPFELGIKLLPGVQSPLHRPAHGSRGGTAASPSLSHPLLSNSYGFTTDLGLLQFLMTSLAVAHFLHVSVGVSFFLNLRPASFMLPNVASSSLISRFCQKWGFCLLLLLQDLAIFYWSLVRVSILAVILSLKGLVIFCANYLQRGLCQCISGSLNYHDIFSN